MIVTLVDTALALSSIVVIWFSIIMILGLIYGTMVIILHVWNAIGTWQEQRHCKHDGSVSETRSCDAICHKCGKNLGFIGTWLSKQQESEK